MKPKRTKKAQRVLKFLRKTYGKVKAHQMLESIFTAALASADAESWPRHQRGEALSFYCKLSKVIS